MRKSPQGEAGALDRKIRQDSTKYKSMEAAHGICEEIPKQLEECARRHHCIINEPEFFLVMLIGDDPIIHTVIRRKFYAWAFLPEPRPNQSVWIYRKADQSTDLLWALPEPETMAYLSTMGLIADKWRRMKRWCDYFYSGRFSSFIRKEFDKPDWLTEKEYLNKHAAELRQSLPDNSGSLRPETLDSCKVAGHEIPDLINAAIEKKSLKRRGEAKDAKGNIITD